MCEQEEEKASGGEVKRKILEISCQNCVFFCCCFFLLSIFFFFAQKGLNDKRNISIVFVTGLGLNLSVVAVKQETPQYLSVCVCVCVALPLGTILRKRP